jgi:hypothetical protein
MNEHLNLTLRSLFRHKLMTEKHYPSILIDTESAILRSRMKLLSLEERKFIKNNFTRLYDKYLKDMEISDALYSIELNKHLQTLN